MAEPTNDNDKVKLASNKVKIDGIDCYSVHTFALLTERSEQTIRLLINKGNRLASLKARKVEDNWYIPCTELTDFPFCYPGRSMYVDRFDEHGIKNTTYISA